MFVTTLDTEFTGVVKFTADWCGPCKRCAPALKQSAEKHGITLVEVDVDGESELPPRFRVSAMPTIVFMLQGKEISELRVVGANVAEIDANMGRLSEATVALNQIQLPVASNANVQCQTQSNQPQRK